jgi:PKD repeat protein
MATPVNIEVQNRQAGISVEGRNSQGIELEFFPRASVQVDFSASETSIDQLDSVTFTAQDDSDIIDWYWEVQDGGNFFFKRGKQVSHTFRNTGKQDVILTATDGVELYGVLRRNDFIEVNVGNFDEFIFDIDTTKSGATANNEFQLPFVGGGTYSCSVDWGDGNTDVISSFNQAETLHTYSSGGVYTVKITGTFKGWTFGVTPNPNDAPKMLEI